MTRFCTATLDPSIPDPFAEIRVLTLESLRGFNYWSRRPVTRMDLNIGAYEEISSADVAWFTQQLLAALPGLVEHQCSPGHRGGFVERLERGTYTAHIVEHVALELQTLIGHDMGFGRTRGTGELGCYTIVLEHRSQMVGLRAAALGLDIVQRAFAGTLLGITAALSELGTLGAAPDAPRLESHVLCGITGGAGRAETLLALRELRETTRDDGASSVIDLSPSYLLHAGLPYATSDVAIVLDARLIDVPELYRDPERAARLVSMVADAVPAGRVVVCASDIPEVHDLVRNYGRTVRTFQASSDCAVQAQRAAKCATECMAEALVLGNREAT